MLEVSTPTSEQWVVTDGLASRIVTAIAQKANLQTTPDSFALRDTIFGIDLTYERVAVRNQTLSNSIVEFRYALYTKNWVLEMVHRPGNTPKTVEELSTMWSGRGDQDRWLKDATLIKLSGV